jgi:hypothetical protein
VHLEVEKLADRAFDLAIRRTQLPQNVFERVSHEYASAERGCSLAQRALVRRVERNFDLPEELKDAIHNYTFACSCIDRAASGTSETVLRKLLSDARAVRAKTLSRSDKELLPKTEQELAIRPVLPLPTVTAGNSPDTHEINDNTNQPLSNVAGGTAGVGQGAVPVVANTQHDAVENDESPRYAGLGARGGVSDHSPTASLAPHRESFSGAGSVVINISNNRRDAIALGKRLAEQLSIKEYFCRGQNSEVIIGLRFAGPLDEVVSRIDFGDVLSIDRSQRVIVVDGREP